MGQIGRKIMILEISGGGESMCVMEPPYAATEILAALLEHSPEAHKPRIEVASKEWLSKW